MSDDRKPLPPGPAVPGEELPARPSPELPSELPPGTAAGGMDPRSLITSTLVLYGGLVVVAVIWGLIDGRQNIFFAGVQRGLTPWLTGAAVGVAVGLAAVGLSRLTVRWFGWARALHREFHAMLRGLTTGQALMLAVVSALGEEALFRGAALPTLGLVWSSVLFGAAHVPVRRGLWPWPFMAFGMGLVFGWIYLRYGDLTGPILAHATINFLNLRHLARTKL